MNAPRFVDALESAALDDVIVDGFTTEVKCTAAKPVKIWPLDKAIEFAVVGPSYA